jgi:hypothetical protein
MIHESSEHRYKQVNNHPLTPTDRVWYDPYYTWKSPWRDLRGNELQAPIQTGE